MSWQWRAWWPRCIPGRSPAEDSRGSLCSFPLSPLAVCCRCGLVHLHRSSCACPWGRHAPAWLLGRAGARRSQEKDIAQYVLRTCTSDPRCADCRDCHGGRTHPRNEQCAPLSVYRGLASASGAILSSPARLRQVRRQKCRGLLFTAAAFSIISLHEPPAFPSRLFPRPSPLLFSS